MEPVKLEFCAIVRPPGKPKVLKDENYCPGCQPGFELPSHYNISVILNKMLICVGLGFPSREMAVKVQHSSLCYCEYINVYKILCTDLQY